MNSRSLVLCTACSRHVRASEFACPFCGQTLTANEAQSVPGGRRVSRAGAFAMRVALIAGVAGTAACAHERDDDADAAADAGAGEAGVPTMLAMDAAMPSGGLDAGRRDAGAYDASARDAASAPDATLADAAIPVGPDEDAWVPIPLYGGAFPDPLSRAKV